MDRKTPIELHFDAIRESDARDALRFIVIICSGSHLLWQLHEPNSAGADASALPPGAGKPGPGAITWRDLESLSGRGNHAI